LSKYITLIICAGTTNQTKNPCGFVGCIEPKQNNFFTDNTNTGTPDIIVLWAEKGFRNASWYEVFDDVFRLTDQAGLMLAVKN